MIALREVFTQRKDEIQKFVELMQFLERKKIMPEEGEETFEQFFHGKVGLQFSYQELINVLKSNYALMLYNIIEYTVTGLMETIYDEIKMGGLSYIEVNESIRTIWRKAMVKPLKDPNSNHTTFIKRNEEIIEEILGRKVLVIKAKDTLPGGNLDGQAITQIFRDHGLTIDMHSSNYRPDILKSLKDNRNNLAHGTVSFVEALRDDSINDLKENCDLVIAFLEELIQEVEQYIVIEGFRNREEPKE